MRVPQTISDFFQWRWAPCVGLTAGSLAFVALALLLIPTRFDGEPRVVTTLSAFDSPRPQRALYASSLGRSVSEPEEGQPVDTGVVSSPRGPSEAGTRASQTSGALRRGFSPIVDRPEPPAPAPTLTPAPTLAPAPAPAPAVDAPAPQLGAVLTAQPAPGGESPIAQ